MEQIKLKDFVHNFNVSELRNKLIPMEMASGWPSILMVNNKLCVVIPYFRRTRSNDQFLLYPISCSVTVLLNNHEKIYDYTNYIINKDWSGIDYSKPVGVFKHKALEHVKTRQEYNELCDKLYGYYDKMIDSVLNKREFAEEDEMKKLFSMMMEPSLYQYYEKINKRFYSNFYNG